MKTFKIFIAFMLMTLYASAQTNPTLNVTQSLKSVYGLTSDTVYGATSQHVDITADRWFKTFSIQAVVTKVGGTVGGTGLLSGSLDGTNYVNIGIDTLKMTDVATNTKIWVIDGTPYKKYRITYLGISGDTMKVSGYALPSQFGGFTNSVSNMVSAYGLTKDTVTNTGTNYVVIKANQWYQQLSFQAVVTKISGTVAGTVTLQGSNDGLNYVTVSTSYLSNPASLAPYTTSGTATMTALNQTTTTKLFSIIGNPYLYYKLSYTGTGTMVATLKGSVLGQK